MYNNHKMSYYISNEINQIVNENKSICRTQTFVTALPLRSESGPNDFLNLMWTLLSKDIYVS